MQAQQGNITSLITHPNSNKLAIGSDCGELQIWDYSQKKIIHFKKFTITIKKQDPKLKNIIKFELHKSPISSLAFSKSGKTIVVGFENGTVKFLDSSNLQDIHGNEVLEDGYSVSDAKIQLLSFSSDGEYCCCIDSNSVTILFRKEKIQIKEQKEVEDQSQTGKKIRQRIDWILIGRRKVHFKDIVCKL
jgi:WD40 repeat protein